MRTLGPARWRQMNTELSSLLDRRGCLVVAHRGTAAGVIPENTAESSMVAMRSGADVVEVDACVTTDGVAYAFHDGTERENLGITTNIRKLTSQQVAATPFLDARIRNEAVIVQGLSQVVGATIRAGAHVHLDRAWWWWPEVLAALETLDAVDHLTLKTPVEQQSLAQLRAARVPWQVMVIVKTPQELAEVFEVEGINLVGVELVTDDPDSPLCDPAVIGDLHNRGLMVMANAEYLSSGPPLFLRWDDEVSVLDNPDDGWGKLLDLGVDAIQTDYPWLLASYRDGRRIGA